MCESPLPCFIKTMHVFSALSHFPAKRPHRSNDSLLTYSYLIQNCSAKTHESHSLLNRNSIVETNKCHCTQEKEK